MRSLSKKKHRHKKALALTLMEVVVATGLIAVISLLAIGVIVRLLTIGGKTAHQTAAALLAQEYLSNAAAAGPPYWGFKGTDPATWTGSRSLVLPNEDSATRFDYKIEAIRLRRSLEDLGSVYQVTITVWWTGSEPGVRAGLGKTSLTDTRTVYLRGEVDLNP